ncbi:MAG TPA: hypothetical protein VIK01_26190 [Polyangiaceae bacterium]
MNKDESKKSNFVGWGQMLRSGGLTQETEQRAIHTVERNGSVGG